MNRLALLLCLLFTVAFGCNKAVTPGVDAANATEVSFKQLKTATEKVPFFWYFGSDKDYNYFKTEEGFYRLSSEFALPQLERDINRAISQKIPPGTNGRRVTVLGEGIVPYSERTPPAQ